MSSCVDQQAIDLLFTDARTYNGWLDRSVDDGAPERAYELAKLGPTSGNCCPARFLFVRTLEAKSGLKPALSSGNLQKTMLAPVIVIVAHDTRFYDHLPELFPHMDARSWFTSSSDFAAATALRNGALQSAYLIMALRLLGLDTGPMSGVKQTVVDEAFLSGAHWKSDLINVGYGDRTKLFDRLPRLDIRTACRIL